MADQISERDDAELEQALAGLKQSVREARGRDVRDAWVKWATEQPDPKRSWLVSWDWLDDGQREADMRIGDALAASYGILLAAVRKALIDAGCTDAGPEVCGVLAAVIDGYADPRSAAETIRGIAPKAGTDATD